MRAMEWQHRLLREWMGLVLRVADTPQDQQQARVVHYQVQAALIDVINGGPGVWPGAPGPGSDIPLPSVAMRILRGRTEVVARAPTLPDTPAVRLDAHWAVGSRTELEAIADQLLSVVMLLAHDPIARRLRRCDWEECQRFYVAVRDHKRGHSFCSEEHRRLFDVATRDPAEAAAYMRDWRKSRARQRNLTARRAKR
jgi:hypothetical protein